MYYVYLLRSLISPEQKYVGITEDLKKRIAEHNSGQSTHTTKFMPWELVTYHAFQNKYKAYDFERYLKTGSGKAFASKRFL
ncbi:MAG: GIY-YIG nuclease family protein [Alphaproteobacteria bacterium]|nr:GIY-YIG nuclease family protein [Alphaproteobacteria bacterium]